MKNRKNNKGFSLVELIVVVAIMAVLVGVLAPAYLRYVEKSRMQKDDSAVAEVVEAVKIALSEEDVYDSVNFGTATDDTKITITVNTGAITVSGVNTVTGATTTLLDEVKATVGDTITFSSKTYKEKTSYVITLESATAVTGAWNS